MVSLPQKTVLCCIGMSEMSLVIPGHFQNQKISVFSLLDIVLEIERISVL